MRFFLDTEFDRLSLISIGVVSEVGDCFYAETGHEPSDPWVIANVVPLLTGDVLSRDEIARGLTEFCGEKPEFYAWYGAYDWTLVCELFGGMLKLPGSWPKVFHEVRNMTGGYQFTRDHRAHNALDDAKWLKENYMRLLLAK